MMGQKDFTPKLFHSLSLSKLVPEGHLVRSLEGHCQVNRFGAYSAPWPLPKLLILR